jgi:hypothetical protein
VPTFDVNAKNNSSTGGTPRDTIPVMEGDSLIVSVNPNDLWNAGVLPRWSNANGLDGQDLFATGDDESGELDGTLIGRDQFGDWTQSGLTAPYGKLVGTLDDGTTFFALGTDFNGTAPASGTLKLVYWDENAGDNTQFVTVQVLKDKPILCTAENEPAQVQERIIATVDGPKVEVQAQPTLNVSNTSKTATIPVAILGCNTPDYPTFGPGGDVDVGDTVLVNNQQVRVDGFSISNTTSRQSCDSGMPLPDLNLKLNRTQFIATFLQPSAPKCQNGATPWSLAVDNTEGGFLVGTDSIVLEKCEKLK